MYCEGDGALAHVAQSSCKVFITADTQNLPGHSPEQPSPADPALSRGVGLHNIHRSLFTSATLSLRNFYSSTFPKNQWNRRVGTKLPPQLLTPSPWSDLGVPSPVSHAFCSLRLHLSGIFGKNGTLPMCAFTQVLPAWPRVSAVLAECLLELFIGHAWGSPGFTSPSLACGVQPMQHIKTCSNISSFLFLPCSSQTQKIALQEHLG